MKITNKCGLPSAFVNVANEIYEYKPKRYSVTNLLLPIRQIFLQRRNYDEIEQDVSDMVWLIFGKAVHHVMEQHDKTGYAEIKFETEVQNGYVLSGRLDLFNPELNSIEDYKTASVWKIIHKDFEDWRLQGLMYAWLLRKNGKYADIIKFHALLKDWSPREQRRTGHEYPERSVFTWEYQIKESDMMEIDEYIHKRFDEIEKYEPLEDLLLCSPQERWNEGSTFAVIKKGNKTAFRVCETREEAEFILKTKGPDFEINERPGEDKKCRDYCIPCEFCQYYKDHYKVRNEE